MNLTVDGDSDYTTTGNPDTFTTVSDGPTGTEGVAAHINGVCRAVTELQALIGNAQTLKGTVADLVTRLSRVIHEDGAIAKGTAFPGTPIDGQPFYRTDLNVLYMYDAGSTSWTVGVDTGDFVRVDGTRDMTGDLKIKKALPAVRLKGTEGSAKDILVQENAGSMVFYDNTGSESVPVWTERCRVNMATGALTATGDVSSSRIKLTGSGSVLGILTHANTAERTYTLPDASIGIDAGVAYKGPTSTGASSTRAHEGTVVISASQALDGIHFYTDFTLDAGDTVTLDNDSDRLIIFSTGTVTINGTIDAVGAGSNGGAAGIAPSGAGGTGSGGLSQPGGGGGANSTGAGVGGAGGSAVVHGVTRLSGGAGGTGAGGVGGGATALTGDGANWDIWGMVGGAGGGGGAGDATTNDGGIGGLGGGSVVIIAPTVVLGASSVINTSGSAGGTGAGSAGGGGGGGAGNIIMCCRSYIDNGCTFTVAGGAGGNSPGTGGDGGAGAAGVREILIYS